MNFVKQFCKNIGITMLLLVAIVFVGAVISYATNQFGLVGFIVSIVLFIATLITAATYTK